MASYTDVIIHSGTAPDTTLASDITSGSTSLTLTSGTGYPSPTGGQIAYLIIAPDTTAEEHVYYTTRSGTSVTGLTRGADGTSAAAHLGGVAVRHGLTAREGDEANVTVTNTVGKITAAGDTLYGTAANTLARLAIGTAYQMLAVNAGATAPSYQPSATSVLTTAGDLLYASSANVLARLAKGTAYQALTMNSGATAPAWAASIQSLMTAAGDIIQATSANTPARLAIGTAFQTLGVNSGATAASWQASAASVLTAAGDILYASGANTLARLAKGTDGQVLTLASGVPSWATASTGAPGGFALDGTLYARNGTGYNIITPTASLAYYVPIVIAKATTATRLSVYVETGGASSTIRLGLYAAHATTMQPTGAALADQTINSATNGLKLATISVALSANTLYWMAAVEQAGTPPVLSATLTIEQAPFVVFDPTAVSAGAARTEASVTGALGSAAPTASAAQAPIIFLRG